MVTNLFLFRDKLGPQRIGDLFIPGTHNSGAYTKPLFFENYVLNQDKSIWSQLVFGIRYFDLRIGYYEDQGWLWWNFEDL